MNISMSPKKPQKCLRRALVGLPKRLAREYAALCIRSERDLEAIIVDHLRLALVRKDPRWKVGANHSIGRYFPDVVCYFCDDKPDNLLQDPQRFVVGFIEIKWASNLGRDLRKLSSLQRTGGERLAWMVYGDHFDASIHKENFRKQSQRAAQIMKWVRGSPKNRGATIFKTRLVHAQKHRGHSATNLDALRRNGWINDKNARAAQQWHAADGAARRR